jgi:hypothetical protein
VNDLRVMRDRQTAIAEDLDLDQSAAPEWGAPARLAQTVQVTTYPTTAGVFYGIQFVDISGTEQEGAAATYVTVGSAQPFAVNLGTQVPPQGTKIVVHAAGGRWAFRYDG